jgi:hypothetical protein
VRSDRALPDECGTAIILIERYTGMVMDTPNVESGRSRASIILFERTLVEYLLLGRLRTVVEVGCGSGPFFRTLRRAGFDRRYIGTEVALPPPRVKATPSGGGVDRGQRLPDSLPGRRRP